MSTNCPNCGKPIGHEQNGCLLATLIEVLKERGEHTEEARRRIWAECDPDALWDDLGTIVDKLGESQYTTN